MKFKNTYRISKILQEIELKIYLQGFENLAGNRNLFSNIKNSNNETKEANCCSLTPIAAASFAFFL
jgi:hypothetical protein